MEGEFGQIVRLGVEVAFNRFVDLIADPSADAGEARETYVNLGRGEYHSGRSLDALLGAYRVGARLAWRRFVDVGVAADLPPEAIYALGEAIFAYIDELSRPLRSRLRRGAVGVRGRDRAPAAAARAPARAVPAARPRRRSARRPPRPDGCCRARSPRSSPRPSTGRPSRATAPIAEGAAIPGEEIVDTIAARLARRLGTGAIGAAAGGAACVIVPDPDAPGRRRQLEAAITEGPVALGPTTGWATVAVSARRAAAAHRLAVAGGSGRRGPGGRGSGRRRRAPRRAAPRCRPGAGDRAGRAAPRARWPSCRASSAAAWRRRCAPGSTAPARSRPSRPSSAYTRRPSATACASCATCSVRAWTTRRGASSSSWPFGHA